jgi:hypothetical protein
MSGLHAGAYAGYGGLAAGIDAVLLFQSGNGF